MSDVMINDGDPFSEPPFMKSLLMLDHERKVLRARSHSEWVAWWVVSGAHRAVARYEDEGLRIVTSFLGLDLTHGDRPEGPHGFESIVYQNGKHIDDDTYATWDEAERGHAAMVARYTGTF